MHPLALAAHVASPHRFPTPVRHVVVIVQENRTVDDLFNGYPGADTVVVDPYTQTVLQPVSMVGSCDPGATHADFVADFDKGAMDGFQHGLPSGCTAYAFAPQQETRRYWRLARHNVLADEAFQSEQSNSFPSHQYLYAGRSCSYPSDVFCMAENVNGPGYCGAPKGTTVAEMDMTSRYPGKESQYGRPCKPYATTIVREAANAGLTWRYYTYVLGSLWSGPAADAHCWRDPACRSNIITPESTVLSDIAAHKLANLVFVTPDPSASDHPGTMQRATAGEEWVASVVDAIGSDPTYWRDTTILLTWDDWGGWYDHVMPPPPPFAHDPLEYGFRVPLVVASAYVRPGTVDHTARNVYGSMLRYVETTLGLPSLQQVDAPGLTDDLSSLFDFSRPPHRFVAM